MGTYDHQARKRQLEKRRLQKVRKVKFLMMVAVVLIIFILIITGAVKSHRKKVAEQQAKEQALQEQQQREAEKKAREQAIADNTLHMIAVGDNLIHQGIYDLTDYDAVYKHVKDDVQAADLAVVNEECIFVASKSMVSGFPAFGAPMGIGDALVNAGFDVVESATNHTCDKGKQSVEDTMNFWETKHPEITVLGIHPSQAEADKVKVVESKGIRLAMLNYTDLLSKQVLSNYPSYMIDTFTYEKAKKDIEKAKRESDIVIVFLHAGEEYSTEPSQLMQNYMDFLLDQGVDIAICAHPHVLQKYETLKDDKGNEMLVYYSLGNFISTQRDPLCLLEGMAEITIQRDVDTGEVSITEAGMEPLVMHYDFDKNDFAVYKLSDYTEDLAKEHSVHESIAKGQISGEFSLQYLKDTYNDIVQGQE